MKLKLRSKAMIACGIGACLFVTTAFADMMLGSGYDKLKKSAKHTANQLASQLDSYTLESSLSIKINDENLMSEYNYDKYDMENERHEQTNVYSPYQDQYESFRYRDREKLIWKDNDDGNLYVSLYPEDYFETYPNDKIGFQDPFQEDGIAEVEKIVDAIIGNLQNLIVVENADHGGYIYKATLNASQVPALVNAVSSFAIKDSYNNERRNNNVNNAAYLPELSSDITIRSASGEVQENAEGIITKINGELLISGKDVNGEAHTIEAKVALEIKDINATVIETPDTSNAIVDTLKTGSQNDMINENTTGTYTNNIVIEQNSEIIKIGERTLQINSISKDSIDGSFSEILYEGYEDQYDAIQYTFTGIEILRGVVVIRHTDNEGNESISVAHKDSLDTIIFHPNTVIDIRDFGSYSYSHTTLDNFNTTFSKVFE